MTFILPDHARCEVCYFRIHPDSAWSVRNTTHGFIVCRCEEHGAWLPFTEPVSCPRCGDRTPHELGSDECWGFLVECEGKRAWIARDEGKVELIVDDEASDNFATFAMPEVAFRAWVARLDEEDVATILHLDRVRYEP